MWLDPSFGYSDGFTIYRQVWGNIEKKNALLEELLTDLGERPLFLFLHYFDIHSDSDLPYEAPPPFQGRYSSWYQGDLRAKDANGAVPLDEWHKTLQEEIQLDEEHRRYISDLYDEGVAYTDDRLGDTLAILRERLDWAAACVALTSDHGEEFCEHGRFRHWQFYEPCVRIPLILRLPGGAHAGRVVDEPATLVDLAPTFAEVAGIEHSGPYQGVSLLTLMEGATNRAIYLDGGAEQALLQVMSVVRWPYKLLQRENGEELYRLDVDPGERNDLAAIEPELIQQLKELLTKQHAENARLAAALGGRDDVEKSAEDLQALKAIGYLEEDP
jgi:arylsulfatase A-like enzyme